MTKNTGTSKEQAHYIKSALQPIQVMQRLMTHEQFTGFLAGNYIKYKMRCGLKDGEDKSKDLNKALQYKYWLTLHDKGVIINPVEDALPDNFIDGGIIDAKN